MTHQLPATRLVVFAWFASAAAAAA